MLLHAYKYYINALVKSKPYIFAHVILGIHKLLHLQAELLIGSLQFISLLCCFLQCSRERQEARLLLSTLCFCAIPFL